MPDFGDKAAETYLQDQQSRLEAMRQAHNERLLHSGLIDLAWSHFAPELKKNASKEHFQLSNSWLTPRLVISLFFAIAERGVPTGGFKGKLLANGIVTPASRLDLERVPAEMRHRVGDSILIVSPADPVFKEFMPMLLEMALEEHRIRSEQAL